MLTSYDLFETRDHTAHLVPKWAHGRFRLMLGDAKVCVCVCVCVGMCGCLSGEVTSMNSYELIVICFTFLVVDAALHSTHHNTHAHNT